MTRTVKTLTPEELQAGTFDGWLILSDGTLEHGGFKEFPVYSTNGGLDFRVATFRVVGNEVVETIA